MKRIIQALAALAISGGAIAQPPPDPAALQAAQREALAKLAAMDGVWRGPAWSMRANGEKHQITQTERIGPFLGGTIKVIEGRGYDADGRVGFNAFGIIAYDPDKKAYNFRSYALGRFGDFKFDALSDGYAWEIATPGFTIRYVASIKDGKLREVGERIVPGRDPQRIFEMELVRVGDTDWPLGIPVPPK